MRSCCDTNRSEINHFPAWRHHDLFLTNKESSKLNHDYLISTYNEYNASVAFIIIYIFGSTIHLYKLTNIIKQTP